MPKTVFGNGTAVSPAWFNAQQNLLFDGLELDGHQPLITDSALSGVAGNIKADWALFKNAFSVTAGTGLAVNIVGGIFSNSLDQPVTVASAGISVAASSSVYVWISDSGVITSGSLLPAISFPIALVVTSPSAVTLITDLRPRFRFGPQTRLISVFGGRSITDVIYSSNTTVNGLIECRNFTVNAGVTLTVSTGFLKIIASGTVTINGTIDITAPILGGAATSRVTECVPLFIGINPGDGLGAGTNTLSGSVGGKIYPLEASIFGSGGASGMGVIIGATSTAPTYTTSRGGRGGGAFIVNAIGAVTVAGSINCQGTNAVDSVATSFPSNVGGSFGGGGGGSGGCIAIQSATATTISPSGVLKVQGGNGVNGWVSNSALYSAIGGGGGGGGRVFLASPSTTITGATIGLAGGSSGTSTPIVASTMYGVTGGGFGGAGGTSLVAASIGQLTLQSFIMV